LKILHCCLAAFYIDEYGYQENIFPKMHKLQGHQVEIVASTETYINNVNLGYINPGSYLTENNIPITRLPYVNYLPSFLAKKLRVYKGLATILENFKPDIIFLHDCQFLSIREIASYAAKHSNTTIYVDGHTDFINSAKNIVSRLILHGIIYKWCAKIIEPYTKRFYGTLPIRVDFFVDIYRMPVKKVELLLFGADDTVLDLTKSNEIRASVRDTLSIAPNDFVIVSGGKIDYQKNIHILMKAVVHLNLENIKLIVFGSPIKELENEIYELANVYSISYVGWLNTSKIYDYFLASDLAFFPGTHSVLWEQAVGTGLPCVFKDMKGFHHVDLGGNCLFIKEVNMETIKSYILKLYNDTALYAKMKKISMTKGVEKFSYFKIAKEAVKG